MGGFSYEAIVICRSAGRVQGVGRGRAACSGSGDVDVINAIRVGCRKENMVRG
jgi:hypothetical protein